MSSSPALRRLKKEYQILNKSPTPGILTCPNENNYLICNFLFYGVVFHSFSSSSSEAKDEETNPYEGGVYHGTLTFPSNFPMAPPSIRVYTNSGRFDSGKKICMSMSDFHPEAWNPTWSVRSILVGMVSFWNTDELTTGGITTSIGEKIKFAKDSLDVLSRDVKLCAMFPDVLKMKAEREGNGSIGVWPPIRGSYDNVTEVPSEIGVATVERASGRQRLVTSLTPDKEAASEQKVEEEKEKEKKGDDTTTVVLTKLQKANKKKREKDKAKRDAARETKEVNEYEDEEGKGDIAEDVGRMHLG